MQCRMMYHIFDETESRRTCDLYIFWLERHMRQRWRAPGPSGRAAGRGQDLQDSGELTSAGTNTAPFMGYCVLTDNPPPRAARNFPTSTSGLRHVGLSLYTPPHKSKPLQSETHTRTTVPVAPIPT